MDARPSLVLSSTLPTNPSQTTMSVVPLADLVARLRCDALVLVSPRMPDAELALLLGVCGVGLGLATAPVVAADFPSTIHLRLTNVAGKLSGAYSADGSAWTALTGTLDLKTTERELIVRALQRYQTNFIAFDPDRFFDMGIAELNLMGTLNVTHAVLQDMVQRRYGKIVTIMSDAGRIGEARYVVYGAAKAAQAVPASEAGSSGSKTKCAEGLAGSTPAARCPGPRRPRVRPRRPPPVRP